jgi:hypothetical protein
MFHNKLEFISDKKHFCLSEREKAEDLENMNER